MALSNRFIDLKFVLNDFGNDILVKCPKCNMCATATANYEKYEARIICKHCGFSKTSSGCVIENGKLKYRRTIIPHLHFQLELWMKLPFRDNVVWALNYRHLDYMEKYISATLRESQDRTGFTLVEKLPKFMQYSRNRTPLLKIFQRMRNM